MVLDRCVVGAVVALNVIVDTLCCLLGVELTIVAVLVLTLKVVDAVGHVACLLNFSEEASCADGVNASCGEEEAVAFLNLVTVDSVDNGVVLHHLGILLRSDLLLQTAEQRGILVRVHEVPHLCLATFFSLLLCYLVGGVHLDREVLTCVDKLDEEGELIAEAFVVVFAHELAFQFSNNLVELLTCIGAVADDGLVVFHSRNLPALADVLLLHVEILERDNLLAAPQC